MCSQPPALDTCTHTRAHTHTHTLCPLSPVEIDPLTMRPMMKSVTPVPAVLKKNQATVFNTRFLAPLPGDGSDSAGLHFNLGVLIFSHILEP